MPLPMTTTTLGVAALTGGKSEGSAFVAFLLSPAGQKILTDAKFQPA